MFLSSTHIVLILFTHTHTHIYIGQLLTRANQRHFHSTLSLLWPGQPPDSRVLVRRLRRGWERLALSHWPKQGDDQSPPGSVYNFATMGRVPSLFHCGPSNFKASSILRWGGGETINPHEVEPALVALSDYVDMFRTWLEDVTDATVGLGRSSSHAALRG